MRGASGETRGLIAIFVCLVQLRPLRSEHMVLASRRWVFPTRLGVVWTEYAEIFAPSHPYHLFQAMYASTEASGAAAESGSSSFVVAEEERDADGLYVILPSLPALLSSKFGKLDARKFSLDLLSPRAAA